jgi:hypothetical protein
MRSQPVAASAKCIGLRPTAEEISARLIRSARPASMYSTAWFSRAFASFDTFGRLEATLTLSAYSRANELPSLLAPKQGARQRRTNLAQNSAIVSGC